MEEIAELADRSRVRDGKEKTRGQPADDEHGVDIGRAKEKGVIGYRDARTDAAPQRKEDSLIQPERVGLERHEDDRQDESSSDDPCHAEYLVEEKDGGRDGY